MPGDAVAGIVMCYSPVKNKYYPSSKRIIREPIGKPPPRIESREGIPELIQN